MGRFGECKSQTAAESIKNPFEKFTFERFNVSNIHLSLQESKPAAPKRYYITFWSSISRRICQMNAELIKQTVRPENVSHMVEM